MSFARFMELALYCPHYGYYERKEDTPGRRGDFYTSVSVGPLFGELLAFQFAEWLGELPIADCRLPIVEAGAHDGRLAKDILHWLKQRRPALFERIEYWIVEPSARRQNWQRETLHEFAPRIRWFADLRSLAGEGSAASANRKSKIENRKSNGVHGIIFSNELLDAMPVHRLGWDSKRREWFEWGVGVQDDRLAWCRLPNPVHAPRITHHAPLAPDLLDVLPDGFTTELCPAAENWWREAAGALKCGKLLTLDYGFAAEEFFAPHRADGTLRAYHQHRLSGEVLANPGEQDLTAHVNFSTLQRAGETMGLKTEAFHTQPQFLTGIMQRICTGESEFGDWDRERTRQFQTLTHPEHLGRAFRVLVQSRGDCNS